MANPQQRVEADLKAALKAGDKERLSTLRLLLTEVKNERIRRGAEVDGEAFAAVVRRAVKKCQEAAESFRAGGRPEQAAKEEREVAVLEGYLPKQASEAEIRAAIEAIAAAEGLAGPQAMGALMKAALAKLGASADGKTVSRIAREVLAARAG
jgi:hypothetical protein